MVRFAAPALALAVLLLAHSAKASELVLLDFWSPNCGPCMQMKPAVRSLITAGYPVREIDVTREPQLARDFSVDRIPCFVMLVDGQELERVVGATSSQRLVQMFDRARVRLQSPDVRPPAPQSTTPAPYAAVESEDAPARVVPLQQPQVVPVDPAASVPVEPPASLPQASQPVGAAALDSPARLLAATVRLNIEDGSSRAFGTGTIIDARSGEALIITCGHLFRASQGQGKLTVELFEAGPEGLRAVSKVPGQVISYDLERDVALLSIRPDQPVSIAPVAPRETAISRGDRAVSIGCSHGQDPTVLATRITELDRYQGPPNIEARGAPVEGRSGGGLFNDEGQLVGVCFAADYEGNEGLYASLESIHGELDRLGLQEIYTEPVAQAPVAAPPIVRGQEPLAPVMPLADRVADGTAATVTVHPTEDEADPTKGFSATEQAAWEEIMNRAATHEVICIIRPKEPGGQSEVITLDDVSPEFVRALAARQRPGTATATR